VAEGAGAMEAALERVCDEAHDAIAEGVNIIILSDRASSARSARRSRRCSPSRRSTTTWCVEGTRLRAGLVIESGEPREVHHIATLIGYGASVVNPY
jgi:hypothetical protein